MKKLFFILIFSAFLGFSPNVQASVSDGNWWDGCNSATSKAMSFLSDKLGVKLAYAQVNCWPTPTSVCVQGALDFWKMDELSGTSVNDSIIVNGVGWHNGTANGAAVIAGKFGNARNFDGIDDYVTIGGGRIQSAFVGSIAAWIKPSGTNYNSYQVVVGGYEFPNPVGMMMEMSPINMPGCTGNAWGILLSSSDGASYQRVCSGLGYNASNFPSSDWTHIAVTWSGTNVRFYRNGALVSTATQSVIVSGNSTYAIGRQGAYSAGYFSGAIDEVGIWGQVLTAQQISNLYNISTDTSKAALTTFSWTNFPDICGGSQSYTLTVTGTMGSNSITRDNLLTQQWKLIPNVTYSWNVEGYGLFFDPVTVACLPGTITPAAPGPQPFTTPACPAACYEGKADIGLRAQESGATVKYAAESGGTSPLRMFKNGTNYGIILVDPADANASKARVQTSSGVKAFCKLP